MLSILHARLRVQRAPGFPCALCFQKANVQAKLGRYPRSENVNLCVNVIVHKPVKWGRLTVNNLGMFGVYRCGY